MPFTEGSIPEDLMSWCRKELKEISNPNIDIETLVGLLIHLGSINDIIDNLSDFWTEGKARKFAHQFVEKRASSGLDHVVEAREQMASTDSSWQKPTKKNKKKSRGQKLDSSMLGFNVVSTGMNRGGIDHVRK